MSWITNLFKKKPKRLPARDGIGRFLADGNGNQLFTDSPKEEIEKAKAKLLKKDEDLIKYFNTIRKTTVPLKSNKKKCACGGECKCASKKSAPKTVAKKPVAKKVTPTTAKKATPKKK